MHYTITTTATYRPSLIKKTFESFKKNMFNGFEKYAKVVVNVDPVGIDLTKKEQEIVKAKGPRHVKKLKIAQEKIEKVLFDFGPASLYIKWAKQAHFPTAFRTVMERADKGLIFNLEEDFELLTPVDFKKMYTIMRKNHQLIYLGLTIKPTDTDRCKRWNKFIPYGKEFFEVPQDLIKPIGWCGHPGFTRQDFMAEALKVMNPEANPEKQFHHNKKVVKLLAGKRSGIFCEPDSPAQIKDLGRDWMVKHNWEKDETQGATKAWFTNWKKVENNIT